MTLVVVIRHILLPFYRLHDIPNVHIKFDSNRSGSFQDCLIKLDTTVKQADGNGDLFFRTFGIMKRHEIHKNSQSPDGPFYNTSLRYARKIKTRSKTAMDFWRFVFDFQIKLSNWQ